MTILVLLGWTDYALICRYPLQDDTRNNKSRKNRISHKDKRKALHVFHKQWIEAKNKSKFYFLDVGTLCLLFIFILFCIGFSQTQTREGNYLPANPILLVATYALSLYSIVFVEFPTIENELTMKYLNLFPLLPFKKAISLSIFPMFKTYLLAALAFLLAGSVIKASPLLTLGCVLLYYSQFLLVLAAHFIFIKFFGLQKQKNGLLKISKFFIYVSLLLPNLLLSLLFLTSFPVAGIFSISILFNSLIFWVCCRFSDEIFV